MIKKSWRTVFDLVKETFKEFNDDQALYYSASLAFFTIFALPPVIIIIIAVAGTMLGKETISHEIYQQIGTLAGQESAAQIRQMVNEANSVKSSFFSKSLALATLLFAATGVFTAIQNALNIMWDVKVRVRDKKRLNILRLIKDRILSFALIVTIAFLLLVSLVVHAGLVALIKFINIEKATVLLMQATNFILPLMVTILLFALIFKFLPDVKISWKDVWVGALTTGMLFTLGKFLIGLYIGTSDLSSAYGAAGTIIVILLWVYLSSILLFLGAEFTHVYARKYGSKIEPAKYAVRVEKRVIEDPE